MKRTVKLSTKSCCMAKEAYDKYTIRSGFVNLLNCFTSFSAGTSTFLNEFNFLKVHPKKR